MPIMYASHDDGTLYPECAIDAESAAEHFDKYDVPPVVTLTADELAFGDGRIVEILVRAGKITRVL